MNSKSNLSKTAVVQKKPINKLVEHEIEGQQEQESISLTKITEITLTILKQTEQEPKLKKLDEKMRNFLKQELNMNVNLILKTTIEDDQSMLKLSAILSKVFSSYSQYILSLKWSIQGDFTDPGQSKVIGEILSKLISLKSLNLTMHPSFFGDKCAGSLAQSLNYLAGIHVLRIHLKDYSGKILHKLTDKGRSQILNSIGSMPELQVLEQNLSANDYQFPPKLASIRCPLFQFIRNYEKIEKNKESQKIKLIDQVLQRKNMIVEVIMGNSDIGIEELDKISVKQLENLFIKLLCEFPYLTRFKCEIYQHLTLKLDVLEYKRLLEIITAQRYNAVIQLTAFKNIIAGILLTNPQLVQYDLLIE